MRSACPSVLTWPRPTAALVRLRPLRCSKLMRCGLRTGNLASSSLLQGGSMRRREFIALVGGGAAWPIAAHAQQPAMPVIGLLSSRSEDSERLRLAALRQGLGTSGYRLDQNLKIEYRLADRHYA